MQTKWISSSSHRDSNSNPRMRPGAFSNPMGLSRQPQEPQGMRPGRAYHFQGQKRSQEKHISNTSFEGLNKLPHYMNSENEIFTSLGESQVPTVYSEQYNFQHNMSSQPLAEQNNNRTYTRESRSQPHSHTARVNTNEKSNKGSDENQIKQSQQGTYAKILQNSQALNRSKESRDKSPGGYSKKRLSAQVSGSTSRKTSRANGNDENSNDLSQPKVARSQSSLALTSTENKGQNKSSHHRSSEGFFMQEQDMESLLRSSKDNTEAMKTINKLTAELQSEKKKCAVLEAEAENCRNDLVKEREKYKEELCKISQQIKKLRNIQNIYVTEKKNSEKLENQLNMKEKALNDTSYLLCESLKAIVNVLELILLKGDVALDKHWKARDFSPEMMFRLFNDIRKQLLPKIEEAETYNLGFEWKCHDYKDILTNTKEFLKLRKTHSSKNLNAQKDHDFASKESKSPQLGPQNSKLQRNNSDNMNNTIFSPVFAQGENHMMNVNPAYDMPKKSSEPDIFKSKTPSDGNQRDKAGSKSLNELQAQLQKINDYVPFHTRLSLAEIKMQEDMQHEEHNNLQNKSMEVAQEDRVKKRTSSVSKYWEGDPNIGENFIPGSLGSTIVPRTNNCSGFGETFEHFLGDNPNSKITSEDRRLNSVNTSKNYDLPMAVSNLGNMNRNSSELEAAKNKILKRKQSIEARRVSSIHYDPNFLLNQPGIAENSEESMTSFQKTLEDDSLHKQSLPEKMMSQAPVDNYQQGFALRGASQNQMNKVPLHTFSDKTLEPKDVKTNPPSGKEDLPLKLTRSNSTNAVATDERPSAWTQNMKKDHSQRSLTHDSQKERAMAKEENTEGNNRSARAQPEQFAIAKFDYNAQKDNDLSFSKGDRIKILRKNDTGWWIGLSNNKIGYFPPNFVEVE